MHLSSERSGEDRCEPQPLNGPVPSRRVSTAVFHQRAKARKTPVGECRTQRSRLVVRQSADSCLKQLVACVPWSERNQRTPDKRRLRQKEIKQLDECTVTHHRHSENHSSHLNCSRASSVNRESQALPNRHRSHKPMATLRLDKREQVDVHSRPRRMTGQTELEWPVPFASAIVSLDT